MENKTILFRKGFDWETRFVLKTRVGNYIISTVDLGIDHSFGIGKPLYYETMIFNTTYTPEERLEMILKGIEYDNYFEDYQIRYSTQEEAEKGHLIAIKLVEEYLKERGK